MLLSIVTLKMEAASAPETLYPPARLLILTASKSVLWMFYTNIFICCHNITASHAVLFIAAKAWVLLYIISLTWYLRIMVRRISVSWYVTVRCWVIGSHSTLEDDSGIFLQNAESHLTQQCTVTYQELGISDYATVKISKLTSRIGVCTQCSYACSYPVLWLILICILKLNFPVFGSPVVLWTSPLTLAKRLPHSCFFLKMLCKARCHTCMIHVLTVLANCCSFNILFGVLLCQFIFFYCVCNLIAFPGPCNFLTCSLGTILIWCVGCVVIQGYYFMWQFASPFP